MRRSVAEMIVRDPEKYAHHDRVFLNNPVVMQGMGLAPLVVLATSGQNALMLAVAVALLLTPSRMLACLLSRAFPLRDEQPAKEELEKKLLPRGLIYSGSADLERVRLALAADLEVFQAPLGLGAPVVFRGDGYLAHGIVFHSVFHDAAPLCDLSCIIA